MTRPSPIDVVDFRRTLREQAIEICRTGAAQTDDDLDSYFEIAERAGFDERAVRAAEAAFDFVTLGEEHAHPDDVMSASEADTKAAELLEQGWWPRHIAVDPVNPGA